MGFLFASDSFTSLILSSYETESSLIPHEISDESILILVLYSTTSIFLLLVVLFFLIIDFSFVFEALKIFLIIF